MTIQAIVFDVGGVLEITPDLGVTDKWEQRLNLPAGELDRRLLDVWRGGSIGTISEQDVHRNIGERMGMSAAQVEAFMQDIWQEYLGSLNVELVEYLRSLRPKYQTAFLCNSFVGAREKEQEHYHFDELCDLIIYSHEIGLSKPDPRIYALTCERLGRRPAEIIFLDDRESNVEGARQAGLHGILFKNNAQAIADIQACIQANAL
jgi:epoxide hydrolase-like predicted phosphatase